MSGTVTPTNPLIAQGSLNRILGRAVFASNLSLNVMAYNLPKRGISLDVAGALTDMLETMTGMVTSPAPYVPVDVILPILKTQPLASAWISQVQVGTGLGPLTVYTDASGYGAYNIGNTAVTKINAQALDGTEPAVTFTVRGTWIINNQMWQLS